MARRMSRLLRSPLEAASENQWLLPVLGILAGVTLAAVLGQIDYTPDPQRWSVSVDRARDTLMGLLSLVFAGLSIVLAVGTVTTQNVVGRLSLRLLRLYQRKLRDRWMLAIFSLTATFIFTEQFRLRGNDPDELAPAIGVLASAILLLISGIAMIWYIVELSSWFRLDRTAFRIARQVHHACGSLDEEYRDFDPATEAMFARPNSGVALIAHRTGHLADLDVDAMIHIAQKHDVRVVIDRVAGSGILRGERVGWVDFLGADAKPGLPVEKLTQAVDITRSLSLAGAGDYGVVVLVDMAIMALSPAINDPNTAAQVVEEFTFLLPELARLQLGPLVLADDYGNERLVVRALTFGDYVELATTQIVLYGSTDPVVLAALRRLGHVLGRLDLDAADRQAVEALVANLEPDGGIPAQAN